MYVLHRKMVSLTPAPEQEANIFFTMSNYYENKEGKHKQAVEIFEEFSRNVER